MLLHRYKRDLSHFEFWNILDLLVFQKFLEHQQNLQEHHFLGAVAEDSGFL